MWCCKHRRHTRHGEQETSFQLRRTNTSSFSYVMTFDNIWSSGLQRFILVTGDLVRRCGKYLKIRTQTWSGAIVLTIMLSSEIESEAVFWISLMQEPVGVRGILLTPIGPQCTLGFDFLQNFWGVKHPGADGTALPPPPSQSTVAWYRLQLVAQQTVSDTVGLNEWLTERAVSYKNGIASG